MQIRFQAFGASTGTKIHTNDYLKFLLECGDGGGDFRLNLHDRIFHFKKLKGNDYYAGVLITIKDHKRVCSIGDNNKIIVMEAGSDERLMDFNYFVVHQDSLRGVYQYYHQSCSINQFGLFLKERFVSKRDLMLAEELKRVTKADSKIDAEKLTRKIKKQLGNFVFTAEVRQEAFADLIAEFDSIKSFEFSFATISMEEKGFIPLSAKAKKIAHTVSFSRGGSISNLASSIGRFVKDKLPKTAKVKGIDALGITRVIELAKNPDFLFEHDFDDAVGRIEGKDIDDLENNWIVKQLIATAQKNNLDVEAES